ncbi:acetyltransferase [Actinomycetospora endophytica]|uniref:Acetyltransferase n=1 Tax=Actinomycetospora endophytica TaxID=2291215 RepID=A0ABS8PB42_9PSEU|nr:acetyltransferase [Actinomycetospora endophytica]MCD2195482.1 acetyltransferase [Actinomycetospora endophytica]
MTWEIRDAEPADLDVLVDVWRRAVESTHHFLRPGEVAELEPQARAEIARAAVRVATGPDGPVGFLGGSGGVVDMLFVDPSVHGRGAGSALVDEAAAHHRVLTVDVNEQNTAASAWYARRGFVQTGRSETDTEGRPYPLLHLRRVTPPSPATRPTLQNDGTRAQRGERAPRVRGQGTT